MAITLEKLGAGHDNDAGAVIIRQLDAAFLSHHLYHFPILKQWGGSSGRRADSRGIPKDYGRKSTGWFFRVLTEEQAQVLKALEGEVTLYDYDKDDKAWKWFNGTMYLDRLTPDHWDNRGGYWVEIVAHFILLTEYTP